MGTCFLGWTLLKVEEKGRPRSLAKAYCDIFISKVLLKFMEGVETRHNIFGRTEPTSESRDFSSSHWIFHHFQNYCAF